MIFDLPTRTYASTGRNFPTRLRHVEWSPDGKYIAASGYNSIVYVWDSQDLQLVQQFTGHKGMIMCLAWNSDSVRLAVGGISTARGEMIVWHIHQAESVYAIDNVDYAVSSLAWDMDSETLITGGSDGTLRWWDLHHGAVLDIRNGHEGVVHTLRRSPDQSKLASGGSDGVIVVWNTYTRSPLQALRHARPYERLDITGIEGFTETQKALLRALGAFEST